MADDPQDLLRLADEVEKATGPDRKLDCEIWFALTGKTFMGFEHQPNRHGLPETYDWVARETPHSTFSIEVAPRYTGSLDASTRLMPSGCLYRSGNDGTGPDPSRFFCEAITEAPACHHVRVVAGTEECARTACALKARAASIEDNDNG